MSGLPEEAVLLHAPVLHRQRKSGQQQLIVQRWFHAHLVSRVQESPDSGALGCWRGKLKMVATF